MVKDWYGVIAAGLVAVSLFSAFLGGVWFEGHYGDPVEMRLTLDMQDVLREARESIFGLDLPRSGANVQYMYFDGGAAYTEGVMNGKFPPRCRNVPDGAGCIDWFNPGEKNWNTVLKNRPVVPPPPKAPPALWEKALAKFEAHRVSP